MEAAILPQIGQIGRGQQHAARAEVAGGGRGEIERNDLRIGRIEAAGDHHVGPVQIAAEAQIGLAVRKAPHLDLADPAAETIGQRRRQSGRIVQGENDRRHLRPRC